jgi:hypothetical protein
MEAVRLRPGIRVSARSILSPELEGRAMAVHQDRGLDELLDKLPREDAKDIVKSLIVDSIRETLGQSDAVMAMVDDLTSETGDTREDLLLKAMILFETALKATRKGQRLVLVESDYRFIQEIVGIDRLKPEAATSENIAKSG